MCLIKSLIVADIDYATSVCLKCWRTKQPTRKLQAVVHYMDSQEMPLSLKHIFAEITYTMPLFERVIEIVKHYVDGDKNRYHHALQLHWGVSCSTCF